MLEHGIARLLKRFSGYRVNFKELIESSGQLLEVVSAQLLQELKGRWIARGFREDRVAIVTARVIQWFEVRDGVQRTAELSAEGCKKRGVVDEVHA